MINITSYDFVNLNSKYKFRFYQNYDNGELHALGENY